MEQIFQEDPDGSFGGGAGKLPHRQLATEGFAGRGEVGARALD